MANPEFEMPTLREIEIDLALGSDGWQSLLAADRPTVAMRADRNDNPLPQAGALGNRSRGRRSISRRRFEQPLSRP
jgi:hypothetical protein